ncbi:uncharacterized protein HD556DRAFT_1403608 [Suillus plorans]|uniref:Uncharacterized protein n=1 Tax=Suillus plorans TaxID=116603 RepID=A0A9P7AHJ4_9AGAM|nr:uncharacterized protein HD556DRAFT_1403608 [Suillus plorans]KAG1788456.1 hypothetical protein HD556DRAFT_1403608 [Suillus plorans]
MSIEPVPLFYGDYSGNEEPSTWFTEFQLSLPTTWTDTQRVRRFSMQLVPGQMADQWFQSLNSVQTATFAALTIAFFKRWPLLKPPKLSRAQQRERVAAHALKEGDIGALAPNGNFAHVVWATEISQLALGMGDLKGDLIEDVLEGIPDLLKDHLTCSYSTWDEFVEDVLRVPSIKLQRSCEKLEDRNRRDADIAQLKAWSSSVLLPSYLPSSPITNTNLHTAPPTWADDVCYTVAQTRPSRDFSALRTSCRNPWSSLQYRRRRLRTHVQLPHTVFAVLPHHSHLRRYPTFFDNSPYHFSHHATSTPHCPTCRCQKPLRLVQPPHSRHFRTAATHSSFVVQPRTVAFGEGGGVPGWWSGAGFRTPARSSFVVQPRTVAFGGVAYVAGRSGRTGREWQGSWRGGRSPGS